MLVIIASAIILAPHVGVSEVRADTTATTGNLGIIKGVVRDSGGSPIANATVAIFKAGTSRLLKQVRSRTDGSFLTRILPGTYTILAVAQGFNSQTLAEVEVNRSSELVYGFKLERSGSGNTLPETRVDRNSSKWRIRATQGQRSIYQGAEGDLPADESDVSATETAADDTGDELDVASDRKGQTVVESYISSNGNGSYVGLNAATLIPISENAEVIFAGQTGRGSHSPQRFETSFRFRPSEDHNVTLNASYGNLGTLKLDTEARTLGQVSLQALDEWKIRGGMILVVGIDYSQFTGAGSDFSVSPRLGLQFDLDSKTRFRTAYTTQANENPTWSQAIELEGSPVVFREPVSIEDLVIEGRRPLMNKSRRFEFGIERVLDNSSTVEANAFFDTTLSRGVGLTNIPFDTLSDEGFGDFVTNQQGRSHGVRIVYSRRLNGIFSTAGGYAFGSGQKLSTKAISDPDEIFTYDIFSTYFGQLQADLKTGTSIKAVFRLSSDATVFAIDPFKGRLAIYDPGLSVVFTQDLPSLGLPFDARAIVDARNLFDLHPEVAGESGVLRINGQRRALRGGILVRF